MLEKQPNPPQQKCLVKKENVKKEKAWKQYVEVDKRKYPYGKAIAYLIEDMKSFAKGLNPCYGWNDQPMDEKDCFFEHLYASNVSCIVNFERGEEAQVSTTVHVHCDILMSLLT